MSEVMEMQMAGKPKKEKGTTHVRVMVDLAEMISWIVRLENLEPKGGSAILLDPIVRPRIRARYQRYAAQIATIKAAEAEVRKAEEAAQSAIGKKSPRSAE